ncbi:MAG: response regulator, partial [Chloroflexi bacterium]|nr:response regulator [Chloroflexota bacterium]
VLVVEDDVSIRQLVADILEDAGYDVVTASDGTRAMQMLPTTELDAILLDMHMPGMNGSEFVDACRLTPGPRVPIIVFTAGDHAPRVARGIHADGFVSKPFDVSELLGVIDNVISLPRA